VGLAGILLLLLLAALAPVLSPYDYAEIDLRNTLASPSREHLLGTDNIGRDVLSRLIYGARVSLTVGSVAVGLQISVGSMLGLAAGFFGGIVDQVVMRLVDWVMAFPSLLLMLVAAFILGPGIVNVMLILGFLGWPGTCRLVRGQTLALREMDFVLASRCIGVQPWRIMLRHLLPNVVAVIIVSATFGIANMIIAEAGLSFLGLGVKPPTPSWGAMLESAQQISFVTRRPWIWIPPGLLISVTVLAINFVGDGLRDALDPRTIIRA
jgi:peptide/nickel transport system permease protein